MRGANGILLIAIGVLVIWAIVAGAGPCLGGALQCLISGNKASAAGGLAANVVGGRSAPLG